MHLYAVCIQCAFLYNLCTKRHLSIVIYCMFLQGATGKKVAVDGLSLNIFQDQITALLGHNGAGNISPLFFFRCYKSSLYSF